MHRRRLAKHAQVYRILAGKFYFRENNQKTEESLEDILADIQNQKGSNGGPAIVSEVTGYRLDQVTVISNMAVCRLALGSDSLNSHTGSGASCRQTGPEAHLATKRYNIPDTVVSGNS
jgi:hypothetical protein